MNERMLELYRQAFVPHTTTCPDNNMPYKTVLFSTEKFAELIVQECVSVAHPKLNDVGEWAAGMRLVQKRIKQHFGVEE